MRTDYLYSSIAIRLNALIDSAVTKLGTTYTGERFRPSVDWRLDMASSKINEVTAYLAAAGVVTESESKLFGDSEDWIYAQGDLYVTFLEDKLTAYTPPV